MPLNRYTVVSSFFVSSIHYIWFIRVFVFGIFLEYNMYGKVLFNYKANNSNIEDKDDYEVDLAEGSVIIDLADVAYCNCEKNSKKI